MPQMLYKKTSFIYLHFAGSINLPNLYHLLFHTNQRCNNYDILNTNCFENLENIDNSVHFRSYHASKVILKGEWEMWTKSLHLTLVVTCKVNKEFPELYLCDVDCSCRWKGESAPQVILTSLVYRQSTGALRISPMLWLFSLLFTGTLSAQHLSAPPQPPPSSTSSPANQG